MTFLALASCASQSVSNTELSAVKSEIRSLEEQHAQLQRRVEQLEHRESKLKPSSPASGDSVEIPSLTVIKMKPRREAVPPVDIKVPVREPSAEAALEWTSQKRHLPADSTFTP